MHESLINIIILCSKAHAIRPSCITLIHRELGGCTTEQFRIQWTLPLPRRRNEELMTENEQLVQATIRSGDAALCAVDGGELVYRLTGRGVSAVSYTHLRAHETRHDLVCR